MRLFRRRLVPVPTLAGWVVLAAIVAVGAFGFVRALFPLLAPNDPVGGGILVVEGWSGPAVYDEAVARFRRGGYDKIVTTGGPLEEDMPYSHDLNWAAYAAAELRRRGVDPASIVAVPAPASARERTYLTAVMLRDWAAQQRDPVTRFDLITRGPHGLRSRRLFRTALGDGVDVGVVSVPSREYDADRWWASSEGTRSVVTEALGMAWTLCCFDPGPRGSEQEKWDE